MPKLLLTLFAALLVATASLEPEAAGQRKAGAGTVQTISIRGAPVAITLGAGGPWVLVGDGTGERLLRLDAATGALRATIDLSAAGTENGGAAAHGNAVWAATGAWLYRIDPATLAVTARIHVGGEATSVLVTGSVIWVTRASGRLGQLVRVDPRSDRVVARVTMGGGPVSAAEAFGSIWVANSSPSSVMRVDPHTSRVVQTLLTGRFSSSLTFADGLLWIAGDRTLIGLDAHGVIARRTQLPRTVIDIVAAGGKLWGTDEYGAALGRLLKIDPVRGRVTRIVTVGPTPVALAAGPTAVWVANFNGPSLTRVPY
jgi:hypothetical protein